LKTSQTKDGYRFIQIWKNGKKQKVISVHQIIGILFIPNLVCATLVKHKYSKS